MSEILNHLEDLSEYGIEYTEEDKSIFVEFENSIVNAGYEIKYMKSPVDIIDGIVFSALSIACKEYKDGIDIANELLSYIKTSKYKFVYNDSFHIYTVSKYAVIDEIGVKKFLYKIRLGTDTKFN